MILISLLFWSDYCSISQQEFQLPFFQLVSTHTFGVYITRKRWGGVLVPNSSPNMQVSDVTCETDTLAVTSNFAQWWSVEK